MESKIKKLEERYKKTAIERKNDKQVIKKKYVGSQL